MKTLDDLHNYLLEMEEEFADEGYFDLAQLLAITRYKAAMWDKYTRESRIHRDLLQAIEVTDEVQGLRKIFDENREELEDYNASIAQAAAPSTSNIAQAAAESGGGASTTKELTIEEMWDWCSDIDPEPRKGEN